MMKKTKTCKMALLTGLMVILSPLGCKAAVKTGLDNVKDFKHLFKGKRVGIVTNHTARDRTGTHIVDIFSAMDDVKVTALFGPEHGIYGQAGAGHRLTDQKDDRLNIPIYSLYGKIAKPTPEMLNNVDILVFDIQDIGARFYTYISTMSHAMESAADNNKPFVVLDRPNPINGVAVEGNILEKEFKTFVGLHPIPVRHGMTVGELAKMFNGQKWLKGEVTANLVVIPMKGWRRKAWYDQTNMNFIKPSPNIPNVETAAVYPGLCLLEGTNYSEGRGTDKPFLQFGAPWIESNKLVEKLNNLNLPGLRFRPVSFTPKSSKHKEKLCHGAAIIITDRNKMKPYPAGIEIIRTLYQMNPKEFEWRIRHFDRLCGTATVREAIIKGTPTKNLQTEWQKNLDTFLKIRQKHLIYPN